MTQNPYIWLSDLIKDPEMLEPPKAIVPRLVWKERVTLLAAREKGGKSTLASAAAAAVSAGLPFLGSTTTPGNILIISLEEHPSDFAPRLMNFGANPAKIAVLNSPTNGAALLKDIKEAAAAVNPSLLIWDTLGAFAHRLVGEELESGDSAAWTAIMAPIVAIAREYGATLLLHHSRKSDGKYRDSTAIGANVDVILEMHGEDAQPRVIKGKGRFPIEETKLLLEGHTYKLLDSTPQLQKRILDFVKANPKCSWKDIQRNISGGHTELMNAKNELMKQNLLVNVGTALNHCYEAHA